MIFTMPYGTVYCIWLYFYQIVLSRLTFVWFEAIKMLKTNCFVAFQQSFIFRFHFLVVINEHKTKMSSNDWKQHIHWFKNEEQEKKKTNSKAFASKFYFCFGFAFLLFDLQIWFENDCNLAKWNAYSHQTIFYAWTQLKKIFSNWYISVLKVQILLIVLNTERSFKFHFESVQTISFIVLPVD